jgi:hypothetical protein
VTRKGKKQKRVWPRINADNADQEKNNSMKFEWEEIKRDDTPAWAAGLHVTLNRRGHISSQTKMRD